MGHASITRPDVNGFVYVVRVLDAYKIGHSRDVKRRLECFDFLAWEPELVHHFPSLRANVVEKALHRRFRDQHIRREWFTLTQNDLNLLRALGRVDSVDDLPGDLRPSWPVPETSLVMPTVPLLCEDNAVARKKEPASPDACGRVVTLRVDGETYRELSDIGEALGVNLSGLIRMVLRENLDPYRVRANEARRNTQQALRAG